MDQPINFWPDPYTQAIMEAPPRSRLFLEFVDLAIRAELDRPDALIAAADVPAVLAETGKHWWDLSARFRVPPMYTYAVARGWHRLGPRGLARLARVLDVPMARFYFTEDGQTRPDVQRYASYRQAARNAGALGGA